MLKKFPFFFGLLVISGAADAGMIYSPSFAPAAIKSPVTPQSTPINLRGYSEVVNRAPHLIESGVASPSSCSGFSHSMPLKDALKAVLPEGWKVYAKNGVDVGIPVSYTCKDSITWTQAVNSIMDQTGLQGHVHWNQNVLTVNYYPIPKGLPTPVAKVLPATGSEKLSGMNKKWFHVGASTTIPETSASYTPVTANPLAGAIPVFVMSRGNLVLTDLQKWGAQAGWTVVWQLTSDWVVPNNASFTGNFPQAVSDVIQALNSSGANLHAKFYNGNNTVVITSLTK